MRLVFDGEALREFHAVTPQTPGPAGCVTFDLDYPAYFVAGVGRAAQSGRLSYVGGQVCLDGTPYTPPTLRSEPTYGQALAYIAGATTIAQLKKILYHVCDQFLEVGALDL